jgi:hypothetical protein
MPRDGQSVLLRMNDPFGSARRKLARAKIHIEDLKGRIKAFDECNPYEMFAELNPEVPGEQLHKIKLARPLPDWISEIAGDAVNNLREALDHTAYAVARQPRTKCQFPFGNSPGAFENTVNGNCKHIPNEIIALFREFQPYQGGDDLLWALNQISRLNKHTFLVECIVGITRSEHVTINYDPAARFYITVLPVRWDRAKQEVVIAKSSISTPESYFQFQDRITLFVAFDQVSVVRHQEASGVLDALAGKVNGIIAATEVKARQLGLVCF